MRRSRSVFSEIEREFGGLDFLVHGAAFAPREELASDFHFVDTTRAGFKLSLDVSAYSLIALARGALPLMERRGGGSILTLTYLGSERVFQNYNVMGVAKAALEATVRYLAADLGPERDPRERDFRRADQDARGCRHLRLQQHPRRSIAGAPRCGARSTRPRWPTRPCSSSAPPAAR